MPARSKSDGESDEDHREHDDGAAGGDGKDEPRHRERDREDDEGGDQDVGPEADVREHARPGIPGDERREDGGEARSRGGGSVRR